MVEIKFAEEQDFSCIAKLSKDFEDEQSCNGIKADAEGFFADKNIAVAKNGNKIVGYCYGSVETKERNGSFFKKGQKVFYIDEIYISPKFRSKNIGTKLFKFIENYAKSLGCEILETTAVSKDYKNLLKFYIDKMDMMFWSASLFKKF